MTSFDHKKRWLRWLSPLFGLSLFTAASLFLWRELRKYSLNEIIDHLGEISRRDLIIAFILTILGHWVLTGFDWLGVRYVKAKAGYGSIVLACLVSYVMSHNIGFSVLSGAPFRFRVYTRAGLNAFQITTIIVWCGVTFWLGFAVLSGALAIVLNKSLSDMFGVNSIALHVFGATLLSVAAIYLLWGWEQKKSIRLFKWILWPPKLSIAIPQILLSACDWIFAGSVLYFLFPENTVLPYGNFLGVFVLAQASGFTSQIPGGLGVFEAVFVNFLAPGVSAGTVIGALLAYRGMYYILPFITGLSAMGIYELLWKRHHAGSGG